jgi:hypothetical protein
MSRKSAYERQQHAYKKTDCSFLFSVILLPASSIHILFFFVPLHPCQTPELTTEYYLSDKQGEFQRKPPYSRQA